MGILSRNEYTFTHTYSNSHPFKKDNKKESKRSKCQLEQGITTIIAQLEDIKKS